MRSNTSLYVGVYIWIASLEIRTKILIKIHCIRAIRVRFYRLLVSGVFIAATATLRAGAAVRAAARRSLRARS